MADKRTYNYKRGQVKAQLTRFKNFVINISAEQLLELPERLTKAESLWERFDEMQTQLEALSIAKEVSAEERAKIEANFEEERGSFEEIYFDTVSKARKIVQSAEEDTVTRNIGVEISRPPIQTNIRLPTLNLPSFNGDYDKWLFFKDSFSSLIDTDNNLSAIQKFQYLRSSLKDDALKVIEALQTSSANYAIAWNLLKGRYENKKLIINKHIKELLDPPPINRENHTSLRILIDHMRSHLRALESLGQPVKEWDTILLYLTTKRLELGTRRDWEVYVSKDTGNDMPTMEQLLMFLTERCNTLEMTEKAASRVECSKLAPAKRFNERRVALTATTGYCTYCNGSHNIYRCSEFLGLSTEKRWLGAKSALICTNCLRKGHFAKECSGSACRKCSKKHNTLLHAERPQQQTQERSNKVRNIEQRAATLSNEPEAGSSATVALSVGHTQKPTSHVVLSTALVFVYDAKGRPHECRALLDPGSQSHLITQRLARKLEIPSKHVTLPIGGVSMTNTIVRETTKIQLKSKQNSFTATLDCLVLPKITSTLPQVRLSTAELKIPNNINLADPTYSIPGEIDLLIGAGVFWTLLCVGRINLARNQPVLQKTLLGWIVGGEYIESDHRSTGISCHLLRTGSLEAQVKRFWRTEEPEIKQYMSKQEEKCEQLFKETAKRNIEGRFEVSLPKDDTVILGDSKELALKRLYSLERRLKKQPVLKEAYDAFLEEYEAMGHMTVVLDEQVPETKEIYYLPHQAVVKSNSITTKVRVVFDASAETTSGASLNDRLLAGPNLQEELFEIIVRFRSHRYVITADIEKMFRQVMVTERDRDLQRILWRTDSNKPVQIFKLNTITYGTTCAPYLAIRCLKELATEEGNEFPLAATVLKQDFYMDDVLTGADTLVDTCKLQEELSQLLLRGGFLLRKWRANENKILTHIKEDHKAKELMILDRQEAVSTLGLLWNSAKDTLQYEVNVSEGYKVTKRNILSRIAQIYDPLGLIGPVLINAKLIMQQLWQLKSGWDESVPQSTYTIWVTYYSSLLKLNEI